MKFGENASVTGRVMKAEKVRGGMTVTIFVPDAAPEMAKAPAPEKRAEEK